MKVAENVSVLLSFLWLVGLVVAALLFAPLGGKIAVLVLIGLIITSLAVTNIIVWLEDKGY